MHADDPAAATAPQAIQAIASNPLYLELRRSRNRLATVLTLLVLLGYFGFIGLVAFNKELLAIPLAAGLSTTVGFAIALGLMALSLGTTAWYVRVANTKYDALTRKILEGVQ